MPTIINNWTADLTSEMRSGHTACLYGAYVFVIGMDPTGATGDAYLTRITIADQSLTTIAFTNTDGHHRNPSDILEVNDKLYISMGLFTSLTIVEVDPIAMTYTDVVNSTSYDNSSRGALATDGTYLYAAPENTAKIIRYDLTNFGAGGTELATYSNQDGLRSDGTYLYLTTHDPAKIARITISSFTVAEVVTLASPYNSLADKFAMTTSFIWPSTDSNDTTANGYIHKATKTNLATIDSFRVYDSGGGGRLVYGTWEGEGYIWQTFGGGSTVVARINPSDQSFELFDFAAGQMSARSMVFDGAGTAYILSEGTLSTDTILSSNPVPGLAISLDCDSPPNGRLGAAYTHDLVVSGGTSPYTYAIIWGSLPQGLSLGSSTGTISGTPNASGKRSFTARVTDDDGITATVTCSITVKKCPVRR